MGLFALLLAGELRYPVDLARTLELIFVHDLPEILAGDPFAYDTAARQGKAEREEVAAQDLFAALPEDLRDYLLDAWHEWTERRTPEARFAKAIDRIQALAQNTAAGGVVWRERGVTLAMSQEYNKELGEVAPVLGEMGAGLYQESIARELWPGEPAAAPDCDAFVAECSFPPLPAPYDRALPEAVRFLAARIPDLRGIVAAGSVMRGRGHATSDLDVYVLRWRPESQRVQKRFAGVPAELFINHTASIEGYLRSEQEEGAPSTAHMLATGHLVWAADGAMREFQAKARAILDEGPARVEAGLIARRYAAVSLLEDALDVCEEDPATCLWLLGRAVEAAMRCAFWARGMWQPRDKELRQKLAEFDPEMAGEAGAFFLAADPTEKIERARRIVRTLAVAEGFFEWESEVR